jgi:hypothetical protein
MFLGERTLNASQTVKRRRKPNFVNKVVVAKDEKRLVSHLIAAIETNRSSAKNVIVASEFDCFQEVVGIPDDGDH